MTSRGGRTHVPARSGSTEEGNDGLPASVLVVGAGLIGTSLALALRDHGVTVMLRDSSAERLRMAVDLGAGDPWEEEVVEHAVVAVPPRRTAGVLDDLMSSRLISTVSDVASVKSHLVAEVESSTWFSRFCPTHPIAGRERGGPAAARPELFDARPWVVTPAEDTSRAATQAATAIARAAGAFVVSMSAAEHDQALALVSHLPQLVASVVAGRLVSAPEDTVSLAGQGLRDTIRLAGSEPELWGEIVSLNADAVRRELTGLRRDLDELLAAFPRPVDVPTGDVPTGDVPTGDVPTGDVPTGDVPTGDVPPAEGGSSPAVGGSTVVDAVVDVITRGNDGRQRLPGKHGARRGGYAPVPVVIEDAPGRLAQLLSDAAHGGVNVEDIAIEHAPGRPRGVAELAVRPQDADRLVALLRRRGWRVHRA